MTFADLGRSLTLSVLLAFSARRLPCSAAKIHAGADLQKGSRRLLAATTSATGALTLADAGGPCTYGGTFTGCIGNAVFSTAGRTLQLNLTGPGCPVTSAVYSIAEDGKSATGSISGTNTIATASGGYFHMTVSYPGQTVPICEVNYTVASGELLGITARSSTTSNTSQEAASSSSKHGCFPAAATVQTLNGHRTMAQLELGDKVLVAFPGRGRPKYETVVMFSHRDKQAVSAFVQIRLFSGSALALTADHYVWASRCQHCSAELIPAGHVSEDMHMWHVTPDRSTKDRVAAIQKVIEHGLYNPHTSSGCIVVDGVAASTFTSILPPSLAAHRVVTLPFHILYQVLHAVHLDKAVNSFLLSFAPALERLLLTVQWGSV